MENINEQLKDLSPESLKMIQEAIESKVKAKVELHVEKALAEQDELYTKKLEQLLEAIDKDHTIKLEKVVEAIELDRANKLKKVVSKYERTLNEDAKKFKQTLVESISDYLEAYLEEIVPAADIQEAVKNKKAAKLLESLRNTLAVTSALERDSIKDAVLDGKNQINEASKKLESIQSENAMLKESLQQIQAGLILEQKTAKLNDQEKYYVKKVMAGKSLEFINENFDYTVKLFNKKLTDRLEVLKEEALNERQDVDHVVTEQTEEVITEGVQQISPYLKELGKY
jgi:hypothetical protein